MEPVGRVSDTQHEVMIDRSSLTGSPDRLIGGPDSAVAEQGLGILRNITCTYGNDPFTGLGPSEMGEQRMLWLLTRRCQGEPALALQVSTQFCGRLGGCSMG